MTEQGCLGQTEDTREGSSPLCSAAVCACGPGGGNTGQTPPCFSPGPLRVPCDLEQEACPGHPVGARWERHEWAAPFPPRLSAQLRGKNSLCQLNTSSESQDVSPACSSTIPPSATEKPSRPTSRGAQYVVLGSKGGKHCPCRVCTCMCVSVHVCVLGSVRRINNPGTAGVHR